VRDKGFSIEIEVEIEIDVEITRGVVIFQA